jgi:hypothetical protein
MFMSEHVELFEDVWLERVGLFEDVFKVGTFLTCCRCLRFGLVGSLEDFQIEICELVFSYPALFCSLVVNIIVVSGYTGYICSFYSDFVFSFFIISCKHCCLWFYFGFVLLLLLFSSGLVTFSSDLLTLNLFSHILPCFVH